MAKKQVWTATGRRKQSVAKVTLTGGTGNITVNGIDVNEYMPYQTLVMDLTQPLVLTDNLNRFDIDIKVIGGIRHSNLINTILVQKVLCLDLNVLSITTRNNQQRKHSNSNYCNNTKNFNFHSFLLAKYLYLILSYINDFVKDKER